MYENSVFHVGMPRTSTTWQQNELFPLMKNINFVGRRGMSTKFFPELGVENAINSQAIHDLVWIYINRSNAQEWHNFYRKTEALLDPKSSTWLSQELILFPEFGCVSIEERIKRISSIFPNIKIYISVRRQIDYLKSLHATCLKGLGFTLTQRQYVELFALPLNIGFYGILDYSYIVELFQHYGHECSVIPYELLLEEPHLFLSRFNSCFSQSIEMESVNFERYHQGDNLEESRIRHWINLHNRHDFGGGFGSFPIIESMQHVYDYQSSIVNKWQSERKYKSIAWHSKDLKPDLRSKILSASRDAYTSEEWESSRELDEKLMDIYRESNFKLAKSIKLDLSKFGYY